MSETNFEDLVHFAKTENWLGDTTTVSSYMVSSKEWNAENFEFSLQQRVQCELRNKGLNQAVKLFFEEFEYKSKFLPALCEYLWEHDEDETAKLIDTSKY